MQGEAHEAVVSRRAIRLFLMGALIVANAAFLFGYLLAETRLLWVFEELCR